MTETQMSSFNGPPNEDTLCSTGNANTYASCASTNSRRQFQASDGESQNFLPEQKLSKKSLGEDFKPGTASFGMSVFNLSNTIMGSGILGLAYAMANTGIVLFTMLLIGVTVFSLYSVHLLLKTAKEGGSLVYEELGQMAYGVGGKLAASCSITMLNIGAVATYLYIVKYELPLVIVALQGEAGDSGAFYANGNYLVILITVTVTLPLSLLRALGYLGYTSGFSLLCMVFFLFVVICKKFEIQCHEVYDNKTVNITLSLISEQAMLDNSSPSVCEPKSFVFNYQTVYAMPILTFAFVCHANVLHLYKELKDPSRARMQSVANVSFAIIFVMYFLTALFGYLTFSSRVEPELLRTYAQLYHTDKLLLLVRLAVLTAVTLTVPVVVFPIRMSVIHLLFSSAEFSWVRHVVVTVLILAFTNMLVITVPNIRDIFGFIGASSATMLVFILPSAFYLKLVTKEPSTSAQKIGAAVFLCSGILVMVMSLSLIILDWIS